MYFNIIQSSVNEICCIDFTAEEWQTVARTNKKKTLQTVVSLLLVCLICVVLGLFGGIYGVWKWILLLLGLYFGAVGIIRPMKNTTGLNRDGQIINQSALNFFMARKLQNYYQNKGKTVRAEPYTGSVETVDPQQSEIKTIPFSEIFPASMRRVFANGYPMWVPAEDKPVNWARMILFIIPFLLLGAALYAMWASNTASGFLRVIFAAASILLILTLLLVRTETKTGLVRLVVFLLFLACQMGMLIYTNRTMPVYIDIAYNAKTVEKDDKQRRVFIVREYEDGQKKVIYAPLGTATKCTAFAVAGPDIPYDDATYSGIGREVKAQAYYCDCRIYNASNHEQLATITVKRFFSRTISTSDRTDFHPINDQIIDDVISWIKLNE